MPASPIRCWFNRDGSTWCNCHKVYDDVGHSSGCKTWDSWVKIVFKVTWLLQRGTIAEPLHDVRMLICRFSIHKMKDICKASVEGTSATTSGAPHLWEVGGGRMLLHNNLAFCVWVQSTLVSGTHSSLPNYAGISYQSTQRETWKLYNYFINCERDNDSKPTIVLSVNISFTKWCNIAAP